MSVSPQQPHRSFLQRPLVIVIGAILVWVVLMVASDLLWLHAFGFSEAESWALAIGLFVYLALFVGVMFGIVWLLGHEHQQGS